MGDGAAAKGAAETEDGMKIKSIEIAEQAEKIGLFLCGSAAEKNVLFSVQQFLAFDGQGSARYSILDEHERSTSQGFEEGHGIFLNRLFARAGVEQPEDVRFLSVDGYETLVSEMYETRYYFPQMPEGSADGAREVEGMLSFYKNSSHAGQYPWPTLMFGQRGITDKNKDFFAKGTWAAVAGSRDRAFYAKGTGLEHDQYLGMEEIFAPAEDGRGFEVFPAELSAEDGTKTPTFAVPLTDGYWDRKLSRRKGNAGIQAISRDGSRIRLREQEPAWLFFADETGKTLGFYQNGVLLEELAGFLFGEARVSEDSREIRVPVSREPYDFSIVIGDPEAPEKVYGYTLEELKQRYGDLEREEQYLFFNHNAGNQRITTRGWLLQDLLRLLPEIGSLAPLENGFVSVNIRTADLFKQKQAEDGDLLISKRFLLAYEMDQRTDTGRIKKDTSDWDDPECHFCPVQGMTPFRIYCDKGNANPSLYKNADRLAVQIRQ